MFEDLIPEGKKPAAAGAFDDLVPKPAAPGFVPTVKRTGGQMLTTLATSIDDITGQNRVTGAIRDTGQGIIDRNPAGVQSIGDIVESPWLAAKEAVGQFVPQIGAAAAGALAGGKIGARVAGAHGAAVGAGIGAMVPIVSQTYGGIRQEQQAEGQESIPRALAATAGSAALERIGLGKALKFIKSPGSVPVASIPGEIVKGVAKEGATEAAQTSIEQVGAFKDPTTSESLQEAGFSGVMGGIGGGVVGGTMAAAGKVVPRKGIDAPPAVPGQPAPAAPAAPTVTQPAAPTPGDAIRATAQPVTGPLTGALAAGIESTAQAADAGVAPLPVGQVQELTGEAAARAQREADRPAPATGAILPDDITNNGAPFTTPTSANRALAKAGPTFELAPVAGGVVVRRKSDPLSQFTAANAEGADMLAAGALDPGFDARELSLEEAAALAARPTEQTDRIPVGRARELPVDTVEPADAGGPDLLRSKDVKREPRTPKPQATRDMTDADVVAAYVEQRRTEGTLVGRRFAGDFDAGRITAADVLALARPRTEATPDERLAAAAAQAPKPRGGIDLPRAAPQPRGITVERTSARPQPTGAARVDQPDASGTAGQPARARAGRGDIPGRSSLPVGSVPPAPGPVVPPAAGTGAGSRTDQAVGDGRPADAPLTPLQARRVAARGGEVNTSAERVENSPVVRRETPTPTNPAPGAGLTTKESPDGNQALRPQEPEQAGTQPDGAQDAAPRTLKERRDAARKRQQDKEAAAGVVTWERRPGRDGLPGSLRYQFTTTEDMDGQVLVSPPGWRKGVKSFVVSFDRTGGPPVDDKGRTKFYPTVDIGKYKTEEAARIAAEKVIADNRKAPNAPAVQPPQAPPGEAPTPRAGAATAAAATAVPGAASPGVEADGVAADSQALEEKRQMVADMIATKKANREAVPEAWVKRMADLSAQLRGEATDNGAIYSLEVPGHPLFDGPPVLRNLVPIKVKTAADAQRALDRALELERSTATEFYGARQALKVARTAAEKKAAQARVTKLNNQGWDEDALKMLREETIGELSRLVDAATQAAPASDQQVPPATAKPPKQTTSPDLATRVGMVKALKKLGYDASDLDAARTRIPNWGRVGVKLNTIPFKIDMVVELKNERWQFSALESEAPQSISQQEEIAKFKADFAKLIEPAKRAAQAFVPPPMAEPAPAPAAQPATAATHKDPGEPAEPVTPAVVREAIKTGVQATDRKPSAMKAELLAEIDQAVQDAPDYADFQAVVKTMGLKDATAVFVGREGGGGMGEKAAPKGYSRPTRTFKVEGDGVFTVQNTVRQLLTFRAKVEKSPGFSDRQPRASLNERATDSLDRRSTDAAIANMIDEGDFQAALDFAESKDVDIANVKLTKVLRERLDKWQKDQESARRLAEYQAAQAESKPAPGSLAAMMAEQEQAAPAAEPEPDDIPEAGIASQTFEQWAKAKYAGNEYKAKYLEKFDGNEQRATLAAAIGTIDNERTTADLLRAAKQQYRSDLFQLPRETSISLDVWDGLDNMAKVEAQRHFYDLDARITRRDQDATKARVEAERIKKAPYEAAFAEVDAEIRRLDKIDGPMTQKQKDLSARRDRLREAIYQIGQGKEPDGRLLRKVDEPEPLDLMGFERIPKGNGVFDLRDGNLLVRVEPTGRSTYRASMGSGKSGQNLTEQQAIEWAAATRAESLRIQAADAKKAKKAKATPAAPTPDPFADDYSALVGKTIEQTVTTSDGKTAKLRMDAARALRDFDRREKTLADLKACLGRNS